MSYQKEKHLAIISTSVVIFVCAFLLLLFFVLSSVFTSSDNQTKSSAQSKYDVPCLEPLKDSNGEALSDAVFPANPSEISVRVLNASGLQGFAVAVSGSLKNRGFSVVGVDAFEQLNDTQIRYGVNAIRQAYTLADHFVNPVLVLDDRTDGLIDVIIGRSFYNLKDVELASSANTSTQMASYTGCKSINDIKPIPSIMHDLDEDNVIPPYTKVERDASGLLEFHEPDKPVTETPPE